MQENKPYRAGENMKNTMIEMVTELEKIPSNPYVNELIKKAKEGQFHDYRSKAVCGKHYFLQCFEHVRKHAILPVESMYALVKIREDIIDGVYDETLTDEDRAILKEECLNDKTMSEEDRKFFFAAMGIE
jgi:hypothetical protein